MKSLMIDVVPLFERTSGVKVEIKFALPSVLKKEIEDGAAFDIALLPRPELDALVEAGRIAAGTPTDITRSAVGLAVRAGAPKPDIGTVDAFKHTLLAARSIVYADPAKGGLSGVVFARALDRLGIADAMKGKTILVPGAQAADVVAKGEAELGVGQASEIVPVAGAQLVGPLPGELASTTLFAAAIGADSKAPVAAKAFIEFLAGPQAAPKFKAKGFEPG